MNMYNTMQQAVSEARQTMDAADYIANSMADILQGRLRKVSRGKLRSLKKELTEFNAHTGEWKS